MKATGIVRRIDDLGRVVIPKEIRRTMRIREGDPLEIYTTRDGEVIFKKYSLIGGLEDFAAQFCDTLFRNTDFTVDLRSGAITHHPREVEDWRVTLCDTGQETLKGGRLKRVARYIDTDRFMVTYGDGVADIDIDKLIDFHMKSGTIGTFTGVRMPSRFGTVRTDGNGKILSWEEKPVLNEYINCGFFVFKREFLDYLDEDESCDLEKEPLQRLAAEGQLSMYPHPGQWQCMDTLRDSIKLNELWDSGKAFWK